MPVRDAACNKNRDGRCDMRELGADLSGPAYAVIGDVVVRRKMFIRYTILTVFCRFESRDRT